jgi:hypothetical protein
MGSAQSFEGMGCRKTSGTIHPIMQQHHIPENQNIQTQNKSAMICQDETCTNSFLGTCVSIFSAEMKTDTACSSQS